MKYPKIALAPFCALLALTGCVTDDAMQQVVAPIQQPARRDAYGADPHALERSLHHRIDQYRASVGLGPLAFNPKLADLAREHSLEMAGRNRLDHSGFNGRLQEARRSGLATVTENVAYSQNEADVTRSMLRHWLESPPHRENLADPSDTAAGVGLAQASNGAWYATGLFGR